MAAPADKPSARDLPLVGCSAGALLRALGLTFLGLARSGAGMWKRRRGPYIKMKVGGETIVTTPLIVFMPATMVAGMPIIAQMSPRPGLPNLWLTPGELLPWGLLLLAPFIVLQIAIGLAIER